MRNVKYVPCEFHYVTLIIRYVKFAVGIGLKTEDYVHMHLCNTVNHLGLCTCKCFSLFLLVLYLMCI